MSEPTSTAHLRLTVGSTQFLIRTAPRGQDTVEWLRARLPLTGSVAQDPWSGAIVRSVERVVDDESPALRQSPIAFQYPGLIVIDSEGRLALCYGEGRLQNGFGPLPSIPVAEVPEDSMASFVNLCHNLQFQGAAEVALEAAPPGSALDPEPPPAVLLELNGVRAGAVLYSAVAPVLTASFEANLPLSGFATNTYASGHLTRFWNEKGGPEGETPLGYSQAEAQTWARRVLRPGGIYYLPTHPWRGLRLSLQEPTMMRGALTGASGSQGLLPIGHLVGNYSSLAAESAKLSLVGAKPLSITKA